MTAKTIALLRHPDQLVAVTTTRRKPFSVPSVGGWTRADPYVEKRVGLSEVKDLSLGDVVNAWERLSSVKQIDAQTVADICEVFTFTAPVNNIPCATAWHPPAEPKPIRSTAANPRAFRGTKFQPPTQKPSKPIDLRPFLCSARDVAELGRYVAQKFPDPETELTFEEQLVLFAVPDKIRNCFWVSSFLGIANYPRATGLYWDLDLQSDSEMARCVRQLFDSTKAGKDFELRWLDLVKQLPRQRRQATVELLIESKAQDPPTNETVEHFLRLNEISADKTFCDRAWAFFESCRFSFSSPAALVDGMELANAYAPNNNFAGEYPKGRFEIESIKEWAEWIRTEQTYWHRTSVALQLWKACDALPGFAGLLEERPWVGLGPDEAFESLQPFLHCLYTEDEGKAFEPGYSEFLLRAHDYFTAIKSLPAGYQLKAITIFRNGVPCWNTQQAIENVDKTLSLIKRVCREPFETECIQYIFTPWIHLSNSQFDLMLAANDRCFRVFEKANASSNHAGLINDGTLTMIRLVPESFVRGFRQCPKLTFRTARSLGSMSSGAREDAIRTWLNHPLQRIDLDKGLKALVNEINLHRPKEVFDPVPAKVKRYANDQWELTKEQQARALLSIQESIFESRIDLLNHVVTGILSKGIGVEVDDVDPQTRHAMHALNQMGSNRRALRKFLKSHFAGRHEYLDEHPLNKKWLADHPKLDPVKWKLGLTMPMTIEQKGKPENEAVELTFSIESDPLEVLQMGTYVGSCLGVGGMLVESAASVVLDINKTVVYARNQKGKVVARQLLAISESDLLVGFDVYPQGVSREIKESFIKFDESFATHLGLELYRGDEEDDSEIERLISHYWWDDSAWNLEIEEESKHKK